MVKFPLALKESLEESVLEGILFPQAAAPVAESLLMAEELLFLTGQPWIERQQQFKKEDNCPYVCYTVFFS